MKKSTITTSGAVYLLIFDEHGRILIAQRHNTGYQDGNWQVPAGHIEEGELPKDAAVREAKEEIMIDIDPADLKLAHVSYRPKHDPTGNRTDFFFKVTKWKGEVCIGEPEKCPEIAWVKTDELPKNMTPHVKLGIESSMKGIIYMELSLKWIQSQPLYKPDLL